MKQPLKISIDEKILEMVKDNIPNISEFVEDCFKAYLSFAIENEEERGEELRKAWADFHRAKLNIHLLMKIDYEGRDIENAINRQKTEAWLTVWSDYRRVGSTENTKIEKASKVLEIEPEVLKQTLENTLSKSKLDKSKLYIFDNWNYIEENILPNVEIEEEYDLDDLLNGKVDLD
ncbi:MAG: hypothetical protein IKE95_01775 [Methanobrevibacter sp.]|nr:hypothetical protein [Methanobrevibacter sp.]